MQINSWSPIKSCFKINESKRLEVFSLIHLWITMLPWFEKRSNPSLSKRLFNLSWNITSSVVGKNNYILESLLKKQFRSKTYTCVLMDIFFMPLHTKIKTNPAMASNWVMWNLKKWLHLTHCHFSQYCFEPLRSNSCQRIAVSIVFLILITFCIPNSIWINVIIFFSL